VGAHGSADAQPYVRRRLRVSIDGVCQTVVRIDGAHVTFDAMEETLRKTTIDAIAEGWLVNVERSATTGDEIGGHALAGHVSGTAEIADVRVHENNRMVTFRVPEAWMSHILPQGFIALDGASLTIVDVDREHATFRVSFIPETLKRTTFGFKGAGERVNVEIDSRTQIMVETVERVLAQMAIQLR
jgi:riboflavin synthase